MGKAVAVEKLVTRWPEVPQNSRTSRARQKM